jgi:hypothetical protein
MSNKIIKINRGDSYSFPVLITQRNGIDPYFLEPEQDMVYFAILYPNQPFEKADPRLVSGYRADDNDQDKDGYINIEIKPNDTRWLAPGIYYYTVKLKRGGNLMELSGRDDPLEVRTIVERTKFIINE